MVLSVKITEVLSRIGYYHLSSNHGLYLSFFSRGHKTLEECSKLAKNHYLCIVWKMYDVL